MTIKEEVYNDFINDFSVVLREKIKDLDISKLIFICIGTDRITGDSFGPLVGYNLKKVFNKEKDIIVIGDLDNPISANNIENAMLYINNTYKEKVLIAIDAAISSKKQIGKIVVSNKGINVRSSISNKNVYIGDMSIKGIVSKDLNNPKYNFNLLQNVPLRIVMSMSECVAQGVYRIINV